MNEVQFGMNQYCGPAVFSILTGLDTDACAEEVTKVNNKHVVKGVQPSHLLLAGERLGLKFEENLAFQDRTIYWTACALINFPGQYLVTIPDHYITLEVKDKTISICDNHTKQPLDLKNSARLGQKVERLWKVTKVFDYVRPTLVSTEIVSDFQTIYNTVLLSRENIFSDGSTKSEVIGSFTYASKMELKLIIASISNQVYSSPEVFKYEPRT